MAWFVHLEGEPRELTGKAIREGLHAGTIPGDALVWTEGMREWQRAAQVFAVTPAAKRPAGGLRLSTLLLAVIVLLGASLYLSLDPHGLLGALQLRFGASPALTGYLLTLAVIAALGIALVFTTWRHPARRNASPLAGGVFVLAACTLLFQVITLAALLVAASDLYSVGTAVAELDNAVVTSTRPKTVSIVGALGPRLMHDFRALEKKSGPFETIELTSKGGLVDQALELARLIEAYRTKVVVQQYCLSACILIAVASPESYAETDAVFGFHRTSPVVPVRSGLAAYVSEELSKESQDFLHQHGVPRSLLQEASKHGPESLHEVTAWQMLEVGAIKGITLEGKTIKIGRKH